MTEPTQFNLPTWLVTLIDRITQPIYRLSGGRLASKQMGMPMLMLTTTGRKSGKERSHVLLYIPDGDRMLIMASNNGQDKHPGWYYNIQANPQVDVRYGTKRGKFKATIADPQQRQELWDRVVKKHVFYAHHQSKTEREIPVVVLTPIK
jgi:F420H(2)-dependent quinone reductase